MCFSNLFMEGFMRKIDVLMAVAVALAALMQVRLHPRLHGAQERELSWSR